METLEIERTKLIYKGIWQGKTYMIGNGLAMDKKEGDNKDDPLDFGFIQMDR